MIQTKFKQLQLIKNKEKNYSGEIFMNSNIVRGQKKNWFCYCGGCTCWQPLPKDLIGPFRLYYSVLFLKALTLILRQAASAVVLKCKLETH